MRAAVTRGRGVMEVLDIAPPGIPRPARRSYARSSWACAGPTCTSSTATWATSSSPGSRATSSPRWWRRWAKASRAWRPASASRSGRCWAAGAATRARSGARTCARTSASWASTSTAGSRSASRCPPSTRFGVGDLSARAAAFIEPTSIAVRAVARARIAAGERVLVLGAGPIGQAVCLAARARGASVLLADRLQTRLERARELGADAVLAGSAEEIAPAVREWAGAEGPPVVVEAIGVPEAVRGAVEMVSTAGRVVIVGLSDREVSLPIGAFPFRELDVLGTSCCSAAEFAEAVELVRAHREAVEGLITHEFALAEAPAALAHVAEHPAEVMKAVIRMEG